jgi:DNA-directed RNA polymerase subunit RPC12/RpoP
VGGESAKMAKESDFKCLRCGNEFKAPYTKGQVEERSCPKCGSNSVRHVEKK